MFIFVYMKYIAEKYKGIHLGIIIERELKRQQIKKSDFAKELDEYPQVINEITKQRRGIPTLLALKMEQVLGYAETELVLLQTYYDIEQAKAKFPKENHKPNNLRDILFWDTDINSIDWQKQAQVVIKRVFERGNEQEKEKIIKFYGKEKVEKVISKMKD